MMERNNELLMVKKSQPVRFFLASRRATYALSFCKIRRIAGMRRGESTLSSWPKEEFSNIFFCISIITDCVAFVIAWLVEQRTYSLGKRHMVWK